MNSVEFLSEEVEVSMSDYWDDIARADHFWMDWRFHVIARVLRPFISREKSASSPRILDIGCGASVVREQLEGTFNVSVDGCDLRREVLENGYQGRGRRFVYDIFQEREEMVGQYDGVMLLDVIEHLDDDVKFLMSAARHVRKGGWVLITVPALNLLFGKYDHIVGHKRRYSSQSIAKLLKMGNLEPIETSYWGLSLIPLVVGRKLYQRSGDEKHIVQSGFKPPNRLINQGLKNLGHLERMLIKSPPLGTSVIAIARVC